MLKLYSKEHKAVGVLTNTKDFKIEYVLSGEDLLEFSLSISDEKIGLLEEEGYIRTKYNEYVIKAIEPSDNFKRFSCNINIEDLVGKAIESFDTSNNNINDTIRLAIAGTGWILSDNNITKRRTVRLTNTNALEVLREVRKVFLVDFRYDAINKIIYVYEQFGEDRGVYFSDELNLKSFSIPSDTYDYATRLYPKGKDGLTIASINNGKEYIENFQYSNKIIEVIWEDNRYTDVNSLKEDAEAKLEELSKPKRTYQAEIIDLAKQSKEYSFLDFFLGDTITLLSKQDKFRDKQRIVKYIEYPNDPSQNSCELGNTTLTFEELQQENEAKNNTVDAITSDNGTVDGSKVDSITTEQISDFKASVAEITDLTAINIKVNNLEASNVTITGKLNAIEGEFGTLKTNVATIDKLTVTHTAQINDLKANSATITQLEAVSATIGTVEAEVAKIQTLVNGNLTSENIHSLHLTSASVTVENGFIKNSMIDNLDVSKINAGDISTNKFRIKSDDGGIEIVGATQQFKDKNNKVRVQIGKDKNNNFTFSLFDETGTGVLIDHTGIKEGAIANDLIVSDMLSTDSVGEKQINYNSFVTGFNKDANTSTIKATKIMLNNQNQILDVAFNSLKTQVDDTKSIIESHSTTIGVMQGQISTAINNTQIVKDGQTILLKDDYNRTVQTIDSMKSTIGNHSTVIDQHTDKIIGVETKTNELERTLNSFSSRLSSTETTMLNTNNKVSAIEQNLNSITNKVSSIENTTLDINGSVVNLQTRLSTAESKITPDSIVLTVTSSSTYKDNLNGKVDSKTLISSINQSAETIKINAEKIKLDGTTTVGGEGRHIRIKENDICFYEKATEYPQDLKLEVGFQENELNPRTYVPKIRMGCYGMNPNAGVLDEGNYVLIHHMPQGANPHDSNTDAFAITHRNKLTKNWNGYRSFGNGRVLLMSFDNTVDLRAKDGIRLQSNTYYEYLSGTRIYTENITVGSLIYSDTVDCRALGANSGTILMHSSLDGNNKNLGWSQSKFNQVSAKAIWGDSGSISDVRTKENIRYLDNDKTLRTCNDSIITKNELFEFIKTLKICEYNYKEEFSINEKMNNKIGFIANDVVGDKVGDKIVVEHEGYLTYNTNNLLFTLIGAFQEENRMRIEENRKLRNRIVLLEKKLGVTLS